MRIRYDPRWDILNVDLVDLPPDAPRHGAEARLNPTEDGEREPADDPNMVLFYDAEGRIVGLELSGASHRIPREQLTQVELKVYDDATVRQPA